MSGEGIPTVHPLILMISKITQRIKIIVNIAGPMYAKITRDNNMHIPPKTIGAS